MKQNGFRLSMLITGLALVVNGAPWLAVILGLAGAAVIRKWRA